MPGGFCIEYGDDEYRLVNPEGEEGQLVEYGTPATVDWNGEVYGCWMDDPEDQATVHKLVKGSVVPSSKEEVEFEEEGGEGEEDEDGDGEDGEDNGGGE